MNRRQAFLAGAALIAGIALSSCSLPFLGDVQGKSLFRLVDRESTASDLALPPDRPRMLIGIVNADGLIDGKHLVICKSRSERGMYQFALWTESPTTQFADFLRDRLRATGKFSGVDGIHVGTRGDYRIDLEIAEFCHDTQKIPGVARMEVRVQLIDLINRETVAWKSISRSVEVAQYDAEGAVAALTAVNQLVLDDLSNWLVSQPLRRL